MAHVEHETGCLAGEGRMCLGSGADLGKDTPELRWGAHLAPKEMSRNALHH